MNQVKSLRKSTGPTPPGDSGELIRPTDGRSCQNGNEFQIDNIKPDIYSPNKRANLPSLPFLILILLPGTD